MPTPFEVHPDDLAAMLSHLRRSGIEFLPIADKQHVDALLTQRSALNSPAPYDANPQNAEPAPRSLALDPQTPRQPIANPAQSLGNSPPPASTAARASTASRLDPMPPSHPVSMPKQEPYSLPLLPSEQRQAMLDAIASTVAGCTRCEVLSCQRHHTVPGEGNPGARVCFLGEAPGADEDASGRPFVGRAGQLLTKMIEACTFSREQVYILNTIKCRPPGNRNPEHGEIENCREYLTEQLEIIQPEYIVCLGLVAAQTLLHTKLSIGRLRGQFHAYRSSKVIVTYHPSYLLREPAVKKAAWADLQFMLRDMGITLPQK